jgi:hypothetical protein
MNGNAIVTKESPCHSCDEIALQLRNGLFSILFYFTMKLNSLQSETRLFYTLRSPVWRDSIPSTVLNLPKSNVSSAIVVFNRYLDYMQCVRLTIFRVWGKFNIGGGSRIFCKEGPPLGTDPEIWLGGLTVCWPKVWWGFSPRKIFKSRCSEMRFQANPYGTILPQNDIELLCEVRGSLTACWSILRSEIKVNSVLHRVLRAIFCYSSQVCWKKCWWSRARGVTLPKPPSGPAPEYCIKSTKY